MVAFYLFPFGKGFFIKILVCIENGKGKDFPSGLVVYVSPKHYASSKEDQ